MIGMLTDVPLILIWLLGNLIKSVLKWHLIHFVLVKHFYYFLESHVNVCVHKGGNFER